MFATLQPHVVGFWTPDKPQESMLFPPKSGTVISTLHHQQLHIHQHHPPPTSINYKSTSHTLKSLLNQDLSLADAKSSKEKCAKCSAALSSNTVPVRGSVCSKGFHQKCSTGPKALTCDNLWNVKSEPAFNRIIPLNLQIVSSLGLLTHLLHNLCLLLREITWKLTSETLMVFIQNS